MADETSSPTILDACRAALGVTDTYFDDEISLNIAAARIKMRNGGVLEEKTNAFVKGMVGNDNPDAERYLECFEGMVCQMKLTREYGQVMADE